MCRSESTANRPFFMIRDGFDIVPAERHAGRSLRYRYTFYHSTSRSEIATGSVLSDPTVSTLSNYCLQICTAPNRRGGYHPPARYHLAKQYALPANSYRLTAKSFHFAVEPAAQELQPGGRMISSPTSGWCEKQQFLDQLINADNLNRNL